MQETHREYEELDLPTKAKDRNYGEWEKWIKVC
jgi:hypothetical protein